MEVDKQMDLALGDRIDPVSGNEVPPGSLPEEVRDDIPAQLSEGEYVVPADVVRYYGVKFFEDLRSTAKSGFDEMQSTGRIGGEPVDADLDIDLSEEDMNIEGDVMGYQEGGVVSGNDPIPSITGSETMEYREYENAAGDIITIMFFNGQPMSIIPEGFFPRGEVPEVVVEEEPKRRSRRKDREPPQQVDLTKLSIGELTKMVEDQKGMTGDVISMGLGMINPIFGLAMKGAMWYQSRRVEEEIRRRSTATDIPPGERIAAEQLLVEVEDDSGSFFDRIFGNILGKEEEPTEEGYTAEESTVDTPAPLSGTTQDDIADAVPFSDVLAQREAETGAQLTPQAAPAETPEPEAPEGFSAPFYDAQQDSIAKNVTVEPLMDPSDPDYELSIKKFDEAGMLRRAPLSETDFNKARARRASERFDFGMARIRSWRRPS